MRKLFKILACRLGFHKVVLIGLFLAILFSTCSEQKAECEFKEETRIVKVNHDKLKVKVNTVQELYFDIQPYEGLNKELINHIFNELSKVHSNVKLLPVIPLPKRAYYKPRNRYRADTLIFLQRQLAKPGHVILGLTNKDISTDNGEVYDWGVMGLGYQPGQACVVSTHRLSKNKLKEQYYKVAIHELGHTQGLAHCPDITCLMTDAKGKNNTDKEKGFCSKCKTHMNKKGFRL